MRMVNEVLPHMRAQRRGRVINISSVLGFLPQPYMAAYAAAKHAIEGYTESLDHEVRDHGARALIVQPAYTRTGFEANSAKPDTLLHAYAKQRQTVDRVMAEAVRGGDATDVVAQAIVAAATDTKPKPRYTAGDMRGIAEDFAAVLGRPVTYVPEDIETWNETYVDTNMFAYPHIAEHLKTLTRIIGRGGYGDITDELETLLGRPPKTVRWALENHPRIRKLAAA
ncbi:hypothetical protein ABIE67_005007 [Streptomyces sp. V4I8]